MAHIRVREAVCRECRQIPLRSPLLISIPGLTGRGQESHFCSRIRPSSIAINASTRGQRSSSYAPARAGVGQGLRRHGKKLHPGRLGPGVVAGTGVVAERARGAVCDRRIHQARLLPGAILISVITRARY